MGIAIFTGRHNSARVTFLVHSTKHVLSSPTTVFSTRFPARREWTQPTATQSHRFAPESSDTIHVVLTAIQQLHRISTSLAASWNGVFLKNHREPVKNISPACYDVSPNSSSPLCAGPFLTRSPKLFIISPICHSIGHMVDTVHFAGMRFVLSVCIA
jgi:hypothetical protein